MSWIKSSRARFVVAILGVAISAASAYMLIDRIRLVHIIVLFFGGFAAGAGLVSAISKRRHDAGK